MTNKLDVHLTPAQIKSHNEAEKRFCEIRNGDHLSIAYCHEGMILGDQAAPVHVGIFVE